MKIKILFDGNFEIGGVDRHYICGEIVEVDKKDGQRLIEGLCAEVYSDEPKRKVKNGANS